MFVQARNAGKRTECQFGSSHMLPGPLSFLIVCEWLDGVALFRKESIVIPCRLAQVICKAGDALLLSLLQALNQSLYQGAQFFTIIQDAIPALKQDIIPQVLPFAHRMSGVFRRRRMFSYLQAFSTECGICPIWRFLSQNLILKK